MGIQVMHNDTGFLLNRLWGLDCYGRFLSRELYRAYSSPFCIRGAVIGFLNPPKLGIIKKEYNKGQQGEIPSSYKTPYLPPNCFTTLVLKELFGKALKCKNKINEKKEENIGQEN